MRGHVIVCAVLLLGLTITGAAATSDTDPAAVTSAECQSASPDAAPDALATPQPGSAASPPLAGVDEIEERDLPPGDDASADIVAALLGLELRYAACLNAGAYADLIPLFDAPLREEAATAFSDTEESGATPAAPSDEDAIDTVALRCVRTYPGGYAAALLDWDVDGVIETNVRIYRDTGSGWLVAGEVTAYGQQGEGCEAP